MTDEHPSIEADPAADDVTFLEDRINEFNVRTTQIRDARLLASFRRDEQGAIVAGVFGWTWGGACEIRYLWVHEELRGRGIGSALLHAAEQEAIDRDCDQITLDTHSFQAPDFYRSLGYEVIGLLDGYPRGYQKYYLRKRLK